MASTAVSDNPSECENGVPAVICNDALQHPDFPRAAFITYWTVCTYAAKAAAPNAGECRAKQETLAERAGIPVRTLRRHLAELGAAGFIHTKHTGRSSIFTVTGDRCHNRIPIGGAPERPKRTPRQAGYDIADSVDEWGTNYRQEGLTDRERHMVATVASKAIEAGMSEDNAHDAVMEHMNEDALLPTAEDLLTVRPVSGAAQRTQGWRYAPETPVRTAQADWSACRTHADRPWECTRDCAPYDAALAS